MIGLVNLVVLIGCLSTGIPVLIILSVIILPVLAVVEIIIIRLFCELFVVLLLLPFYSRYPSNERITKIEQGQPSGGDDMDISIHSKTGDGDHFV